MKFEFVKYAAIMVASLLTILPVPGDCAESVAAGIPIKYAADHILVIPVKVCDLDTYFAVDTGAGVNVISETLANKLCCKKAGKVTGKRMSGQKVTMKLVTVPALQVGSCRQKNLQMAAWKLEDVFADAPDMARVQGFVSLEFFKKIPFSIDYKQKLLFIENADTLQNRVGAGVSVPIQVTTERVQTSINMPISFSNGSFARVEVDTGSGALILNEKYIQEFQIGKKNIEVKQTKGVDETGHPYVRYFTTLPADVFIARARQFIQLKPKVQFQKIIYDGLIGDGFLSNFIVTYDLPNKRIIFALPSL